MKQDGDTVKTCFGLCSRKKNKVEKQDSSESSDDDKKNIEYAIKYKDLENLLSEFNRA